MSLPVREAGREDGLALAELERSSPEEGRITIRIAMRADSTESR